MKLCIVRHGETIENQTHLLQGHLPGILTEKGRSQAAALKHSLRIAEFDAIVSSDLIRVVETIELLLDGQSPKEWVKSELFREIDWGSLTGTSIHEADLSHLPADAETKEMLFRRAGAALRFLKEHYAGKTVLVVSHGLFIRSFMARIARVPLRQIGFIRKLQNCEVFWTEI